MKKYVEIYFTEINVHGAVVVYGTEGIRQYYGYGKKEAERQYRDDARTVINEKEKEKQK